MQLKRSTLNFFSFDYVEIQRNSFLSFLEKGIIREFLKRNPITNSTQGLELIFYPTDYQLTLPKISPKEALLSSKTYESQLYVPAHLIDLQSKKMKLQWVLIGNIPLMTKRGHFIINGSPRVIVHQMVRSPGVYLQEKITLTVDLEEIHTYYADLIPFRGSWVRLDIDKYQDFWVRMKKTAKIPLFVFLQGLGLNYPQIVQSLEKPKLLLNNLDRETCAQNTTQALGMIASIAYPKKQYVLRPHELGQKFLFRRFMNPRTYDLGEVGRTKFNEKLGLNRGLFQQTLTGKDFLGVTNLLIKLAQGSIFGDDIDDLKNRRVRTSGELIQNQFGTGLARLEKVIRERMKKPKQSLTLRGLITTKALNGALREFFGSSPLSQYMDQTNPLAEITHKRRLSSLGPGGISRETAGMAVRGIHPTHYGRICPIETPEGRNAGLVNSLTNFSRINSLGFLETPLFSVFQGQVQKNQGPAFFSSEQEKKVNVAPGDLGFSFSNFLPKNAIPIRHDQEFLRVNRNQVEFIAMSPTQMISVATALIPFLEHNDANRALMGSNMQRQAVPVMIPERPIVGTGLEARIVANSGQVLQATASGLVSYVSGQQIRIESTQNSLKRTSYSQQSYTKKGARTVSEVTRKSNENIRKDLKDSDSNRAPLGLKGGFASSSAINLSLKRDFFRPQKINLNSKGALPSGYFFQSLTQQKIFEVFLKKKAPRLFIKYKQESKRGLVTPLNTPTFRVTLPAAEQSVANLKSLKGSLASSSATRPTITLPTISLSETFCYQTPELFLFQPNYTFSLTKIFSETDKYKKNLWKTQLRSKIQKKKSQKNFFSKNSFKLRCRQLLYENMDSSVSTLKFKGKRERINMTTGGNWSSAFTQYFRNEIVQTSQGRTLKNLVMTWPFCHRKKNSFTTEKILSLLFSKSSLPCNLKGSFAMELPVSSLIADLSSLKKKPLKTIEYPLQGYGRSNQDTCLKQRPAINEGEWVQEGDLLADCSSSVGGELAVGKNVLIAYMPWEGYNFEDAILISERLVFDEVYTSIHIERYVIEIRDTQYGMERITSRLPDILPKEIKHLDSMGIAKLGSWVRQGDLLVGKITPIKKKKLSPHEKLLFDVVGKVTPIRRDTSLRVPKGVQGRVIHRKIIENETLHSSETNLENTDLKCSSAIGKNQQKIRELNFSSSFQEFERMKKIGGKKGEKSSLALKNPQAFLFYDKSSLKETFLEKQKQPSPTQLFGGQEKRTKKHEQTNLAEEFGLIESLDLEKSFQGPTKVHVFLAEKRNIQRGDKLAGRHGNKGIVSQILPRQDMPFLPDGTPLDMVLNPLGVPSRMNVGQVFECLLGLAGRHLGQQFQIAPFDEAFGPEASRALVYSKLFQARLKTGKPWLFNPEFPGKTKLFDGRTGYCFDQPVTVGQAYMLKLIHLVDEKIHARSTGPYSLLTQQPLRGKSKHGGQRFGEMEVWALEGFGAAYTLQELLTFKSDDVQGRHQVMEAFLNKKPLSWHASEAFKVLLRELQSLCLNVNVYGLYRYMGRKTMDVIEPFDTDETT
uniref:DNA-directed RNA polymerase subunit beta n=1 Tax=Fusochloris perforata TaxID=106203 RepID=A0A097KPX0_9CHLO|nr:beta subunit of RNA polymerase [Fusochloris perforata]AIT95205.1 beta subunit of RNA polymerase [Fusochloris perforata]